MKVLILGGTGMLGHQLWRNLHGRFQTWATIRGTQASQELRRLHPDGATIPNVDAENFDSVLRAFAHVRPDAVVNCIGIVKQQDQAKDPLVGLAVNALFPQRLGQLCRSAGCRCIHISTDCVFSGRQGNYRENDFADAEDLYGRTKFLGEIAGPGCLTLRTSIIGHEVNTRHGLLEWFLEQQGRVRGFRNAIFSGLTTLALSELIKDVLVRHAALEGIYQVASTPISKYDLLLLIRQVYGLSLAVEPEVETRCNRSLNGERFAEATGWRSSAWPALIEAMHRDQQASMHLSARAS